MSNARVAGVRERRLNRIGTGVVLSLIIGGLAFAATRAEGFKASKVSLHDSGIWLTKGDVIGRYNHDLKKVDTQSPTFAKNDLALHQSDATVIITTPTPAAMHRYDVALNTVVGTSKGTPLPDNALLSIGGGNGALLDVKAGRLWFTTADALTSVKTDSSKSFAPVTGAEQVVVGTDGIAHAYAPKTGEIWTLTSIIQGDGAAPTAVTANPSSTAPVGTSATGEGAGSSTPADFQPKVLDQAKGAFRMTMAGDRVALLDVASGRVVLDDGTDFVIAGLSADAQLQQPAADRDHLLISTDSSLVLVDLHGHSSKVLGAHGVPDTSGDGSPLEPIWLNGCAYGAWASHAVRFCTNHSLDEASPAATKQETPIRFRMNRGLVALNYKSGAALDMSDDGPLSFTNDNWDSALKPPTDDTRGTAQAPQLTDQVNPCAFDPSQPNRAPIPVADTFGVRRDTPTVLDVLSGVGSNGHPDTDPDCDVLTVSLDPTLDQAQGVLPNDGGTVAVISNGRALQYTPPQDGKAPPQMTFTYLLSDGRSEPQPTTVTLNIVEAGDNHPPKPTNDATSVAQGKTVQLNVLANDFDPDGDPLVVVDAQILDATGALVGVDGPDGDHLVWQANGRISYRAPAGITKTEKIKYTVSDGASIATAEVDIAVIPGGSGQNKPPNTINDSIIGVAGNNISVDVLANDSDPNNDELRVIDLKPIDANTPDIAKHTDSVVTLDHPTAQVYNYAYKVDDGHGGSAWGRVRFTVLARGANHSPVAVRDDAVVKQGRPTLVDVLANDIDIDGDVMMVTSVTPQKNAAGVDSSDALSVEVLDHRVLRITTKSAATPGESYRFQYRITDGQAEAVATVTVRVAAPSVGQAPVTLPDHAQVHLGGEVGIPVLANDYHPDGDPISIVPGSATITGSTSASGVTGQMFVQGDLVVYIAPSPTEQPLGFTVNAQYQVTDGQHVQTQTIVVQVTGLTENAAPAPSDITVRAYTDQTQIEISLPRIGLDPDGDPVDVLEEVPDLSRHALGLDRFDRVKRSFIYEPIGEPGQDTFQFEVRDSPVSGVPKTGTITIRVVISKRSDNAPPIAVDDVFEAQAGQSTALAVLANDTDPDGDVINFAAGHPVDQPAASAGTVAVSDPKHITFTALGPVGSSADFSYYIVDSAGNGPVVGTVHVKIVAHVVNKPPVAKDDPQPAHRTGDVWVVDVLANDKDPEGDPLHVQCPTNSATFCSEVSQVVDGTSRDALKLTMGTSSMSFSYLLSDAAHPDEASGATRAVVQVPLVPPDPVAVPTPVVKPPDQPPVCSPLRLAVGPTDPQPYKVALDLTQLCTDPDVGDVVSLYLETQPSVTVHPEAITAPLKWTDGQSAFDVNRDPAFSGTVAIEYIAQDKAAKQTTGQIVLSIIGHVNHPPVTSPLQKGIDAGAPPITIDVKQLGVTDQDPGDLALLQFTGAQSPDGSVLRASITSSGLLTVEAPDERSVTDATGPKSFTLSYAVTDTHDHGDATGSITITIKPSNKPGPNAHDDIMGAVKQGQTASVNVLANDLSGDPSDAQLSPLVVVTNDVDASGTNGLAGHVHIDAQGNAVFTPQAGFHGSAVFSYSVQDQRHTSTKEGHANVTLDVQDKPDRPAQPSVGDQQSEAADVTFATAQGNGSPITAYTISWNGGSKDCGPSSGHCVITGLTNGTPYQFQVTATNAVGTSAASDLSQPYTPDQVPDQPPPPTADWGDHEATVTWSNINNHGSPLIGVRIEMSPADQPPVKANGTTSGTYTFHNLTNGTAYTFTVTAINGAKPNGESKTSAPSLAVTPAGNPVFNGVPTLVKGDGNVVASWLPAGANGDSAGLTYTVDLVNSGTGVVEGGASGLTATSKTIPATNGQTYQVVVHVNNKFTARTTVPVTSAPSAKIRPAGKPLAPATIAVVQNQDAAVMIHIGATNNNGDPLDHYTVTSSGGGSKQFPADPLGAAADIVYPLLTNGTSYTFTVTAHNQDGDSLVTGPAGPGVPFGTPGVPTAECHHNGSFITCTWSYGNLNGPGPAAQTVTIDGAAVPNGGSWTSGSLPYSTTRTLVVTDCNTGSNGPAVKCSSTTKADTTNGPPSPYVNCSNGATTIHCDWGVNGLVGSDPHTSTVTLNGGAYSNNDSGSYDQSVGASQSRTIDFTLCNSSGQCTHASDGRTTPAPPRVVTSTRGPAFGTCPVNSGACYYVNLSVSGFSQGDHSFFCFGGQSIGTPGKVYSGTINVDGNGNASISMSNHAPYCVAANKAEAGMVVDGVQDNGNW